MRYPWLSENRFATHDRTIEIASHKVSGHDTQIEDKHRHEIGAKELYGHAQVIKGIGHTVGEATVDEQRNTKKQRQDISLTGKGYNGGHDESTTHRQQSAKQRTVGKTRLQDSLRRRLYGHGAATRQQANQQTTYDVAKKDEHKLSELATAEEACRTGI